MSEAALDLEVDELEDETARRRSNAWCRRAPGFVAEDPAPPFVMALAGAFALGQRGSDWPGDELPYNYARARLLELNNEHLVLGLTEASPAALDTALSVLRSVLAEDTVYPTMTIDEDGGIAAQWAAAQIVIELDFAPDGDTTWSWRQRGEPYMPRVGVAPLRQILREFSAVVEEHNPGWRTLFPAAVRTHW